MLRVRDRGRYGVAYARGAEPIADALALAGASDAALAIDEHAVIGAARASANRLANADHANLVRTARAAHDAAPGGTGARATRRARLADRRSSRRSPRSASGIPRRRFASSVRSASPGRARLPRSGAWRSSSSWPAIDSIREQGGQANEHDARRHQRLRAHRPELPPSAPRARRRLRGRRCERHRRHANDGAPPEARLRARPVRGDGRGRGGRASSSPAQTIDKLDRPRSEGAAVGRARRRDRRRVDRALHEARAGAGAPRGGSVEGRDLGARDRSRT